MDSGAYFSPGDNPLEPNGKRPSPYSRVQAELHQDETPGLVLAMKLDERYGRNPWDGEATTFPGAYPDAPTYCDGLGEWPPILHRAKPLTVNSAWHRLKLLSKREHAPRSIGCAC